HRGRGGGLPGAGTGPDRAAVPTARSPPRRPRGEAGVRAGSYGRGGAARDKATRRPAPIQAVHPTFARTRWAARETHPARPPFAVEGQRFRSPPSPAPVSSHDARPMPRIPFTIADDHGHEISGLTFLDDAFVVF